MGFFDRFKAARGEQQQAKELPNVDTAGKEAEARGEKVRQDVLKFAGDTLGSGWNRVRGLGKKMKNLGSAIGRGIGSAFDRAIGTPGLIMDIGKAGYQAGKETVSELGHDIVSTSVKNLPDMAASIHKNITETAQGVAGGMEEAVMKTYTSGRETLLDIKERAEDSATEIEANVRKTKEAILDTLHSSLAPERLLGVDPNRIDHLANALVMQGVDALSERGKQILKGIGERWDKGVSEVAHNAMLLDKGFEDLDKAMAKDAKAAWEKLKDRVRTAKNKYLPWNRARIQEARMKELESQNAELMARMERMSALMEELTTARATAPKREDGFEFIPVEAVGGKRAS